MQGKYENKKEAVTEEMEVEASKMEKDVEEDFGVICHQMNIPSSGMKDKMQAANVTTRCHEI